MNPDNQFNNQANNKANNKVPVSNNVPATGNNLTNNISATNNVIVQQTTTQGMSQSLSLVENNVISPSNVQTTSEAPAINQDNASTGMDNASGGVVSTTSNVSNIVTNAGNDKNSESLKDSDNVHDVTKVLSSSFDTKNKVNLLTPQQKDELNRKREEALREKENYQPEPVSKFKKFMAALFIVILLLIVLFLPEINGFVLTVMNPEKKEVDNVPIITGTLRCANDRVDEKYNISYNYDFDFTDSKLKTLTYVESTTGDALVDADDLNTRLEKCNMLKTMTSGVNGIKVVCSLSSGTLTREQFFDYNSLDVNSATTAYVEAGGEYPGEFQKDSDIDAIEKNMKAAGYTCERQR